MFASAFLAFTLLSSPDAPRLVTDPATGQAAWEVRVATVGLTLEQRGDAQAMLARLKRATRDLCTLEMRTHVERDWHSCRRDTLDQAVQRLNAPQVTRAYLAAR